MTIQAISNFITVKNTSGVVQHRYQNAKVGEVIALDGFDFSYLSFLYQGATKNRTGDNLESELYLAPNAVAMNIAREAVVKNWIVQVDTCTMNPKTFAVGKKATSEVWLAASMNYDPEKLVVSLSSGIDAVGATTPTRKLTLTMVGALPSTAQIQNR
jgi:hypothetical protein